MGVSYGQSGNVGPLENQSAHRRPVRHRRPGSIRFDRIASDHRRPADQRSPSRSTETEPIIRDQPSISKYSKGSSIHQKSHNYAKWGRGAPSLRPDLRVVGARYFTRKQDSSDAPGVRSSSPCFVKMHYEEVCRCADTRIMFRFLLKEHSIFGQDRTSP